MQVKIGDRVTVTRAWAPQQIQVYGNPNGHASFGLNPGDVGSAVIESSPGIWIIIFDKAITESVLVADLWLAPAPPESIVIDLEISDEPKPCVCTVATLMAQGCICGHIKRYVPPHKRTEEASEKRPHA